MAMMAPFDVGQALEGIKQSEMRIDENSGTVNIDGKFDEIDVQEGMELGQQSLVVIVRCSQGQSVLVGTGGCYWMCFVEENGIR